MESTTSSRAATGQKAGGRAPSLGSRAHSFVIPMVIAGAAGIICYGLFFRRGIWLSVIGYSISPAERVLRGEVPYRDFFFNYTPGILWVNALLMRLFGPALLPVHAGLLLFKVSALIALYYAGRRVVSDWAALIPVALTLAWLGYRHIFNVHPTQYSMLFVLLGLIWMLRHQERGSRTDLFLSGFALGVVFLFKYNVGLLLLVAGTTAVVIRQVLLARHGCRATQFILVTTKICAVHSAGFAVAVAPMVVYMWHAGALGPMVDHFLHHASEYSEERAIGLPPLRSLAPVAAASIASIVGALAVLRIAPRVIGLYLVFIMIFGSVGLLFPGRAYVLKESATAGMNYFPPAVLLGGLLTVLGGLRNGLRVGEPAVEYWRRNRSVIIVGLFAAAAYLEVFPRADYYHLVRVLPPVFLLLVLLMARSLASLKKFLGARAAAPGRDTWLCASVPLVILLSIGLQDTWKPQFDSRFRFKDRTPLALERARGILVGRRQAEMIDDLVELISKNSGPDDSIFSFARRGGGFYFLAGRPNPTRLLWWDSVGIKRVDREAVLRTLSERLPKLILIQSNLTDPQIRDLLTGNYHRIGAAADVEVYDRNP